MALPFRCAALLFDLDGVLVDSAECVERIWRHWAVQHHIDPARVIALAHGRRTIETVQLVAPHLAAAEEAAALAAHESNTTEGIHEVPGARDLLHRLPPNAWAIVTSGTRAVATLRIRHTGLPMPRVLVCADEIRCGKPDPEGYLAAAERLGYAPADCVVIEDAPAGLEAGRAAGMRTVGVSGTYAASALAIADVTVPRLGALRVTRPANGAGVRLAVVVSRGTAARHADRAAIRRSDRMPPPPVVLDTNVFVAAGFNPRSASAKIVEAVKQGRLRMVWNDATRRETERIMRRIPPLRAQAVGQLFRPEDRFTGATHPERFDYIPDPDDRKFAALAHAAGAILISNDEHLLHYRDRMDLTVLTPGAFWRRQRRMIDAQEET